MNDHAKESAQATVENIVELMNLWDEVEKHDIETATVEYDGEQLTRDQLQDRITELPLSLQVRSGWHTPGEAESSREYELLMSTGGPGVRIVGDLNNYGEAETARVEYQDWGTPWTEYRPSTEDEKDVLAFAQQFTIFE
jgi:hypothetical protein